MKIASKNVLRTGALALTVLLAGGALASCSTGGSDASAENVIFALKEDPGCLDPQQVTLTTALNVSRQLTDSLLDQDPASGELKPWLAKTWASNDDLTQFTFTLRDDVTFSDETKLTADVVKANLDALFDMGAQASLASQLLAGYTGTDVVDPTTIKVSFSAPNAQFLQGASTTTLGMVSEATTKASAEERCQGILGSGPFVLDSYTQNDSVEISQRAGYNWGSELRQHTGESLVKTVSFPIISENSVRTGGLASGEFDVIQDVPYADEARFTSADYNLYAAANPGIPNSLIANTSKGLLGDATVRKALQMGLDREEINTLTGSASGKAPSSALTSTTTGYVSQADAMTFDAAGAKALLEGDGWTLGADGIYAKDGKALTISVTAFYAQDVLEAVQMQLKKIGVDLKLNMVTAGDFFGAVASHDYEFLGAALTRTDPDVLRVALSKDSGSAWGIIDNPELEKLLQEQAKTADADARQALVAKVQALVIKEGYVIPTLETVQLHASTSNVSGIVFDSASRINLYDMTVAK
ncbi:ABC-type dipeptide/oligopeptide/nickel transport system, periplasmic component [Arthrobacter sp. PAMC 25486]|uniref:ABC transporter substrate-binding protein n=1 Tax=Arthrobacter sp. PAMC 25486 TaxID=1494608 RepID=UPI000535EA25|nr:ABC transporter substrate-binding protein [Arthrobacter sp. PAMC 25486]AIY02288.1 ABC-type dipeptide/oligopeptide/nickel transport system, periplasmic component [Arthrobacter sp. PAMC 25486]